MSRPRIETYGLTDIGHIREKNDDAFKILQEDMIFILADGMGGHKAGDIASKHAIDYLSSLLLSSLKKTSGTKEIMYHIDLAIKETNYKIFTLSKNNKELTGMGTTLCLLHLTNDMAFFAHVGDSRIYHLSNNNLSQLTKDHSLINKLKAKGLENINFKSIKNIITKAIGTNIEVIPSISHIEYSKNDLFMLCSDGLSDYIEEKDIFLALKEQPLEKICQHLIELAKFNGSTDNITCIIIKII